MKHIPEVLEREQEERGKEVVRVLSLEPTHHADGQPEYRYGDPSNELCCEIACTSDLENQVILDL